MTGPDRRPLVIGIGNRLRGDDGIGPTVIDLIGHRHGAAVDRAVVEGDLSDLAMRWDPDQTVVIVDALNSGRAPGTMITIDGATAASGTGQMLSSHGLGLAEAIALARAIGRLPGSLTVVAVEGQTFEHGHPLSGPVRAAASAAVDRVEELIGIRAVSVDRH